VGANPDVSPQNARSHALLGNADLDALRRLPQVIGLRNCKNTWLLLSGLSTSGDAERPGMHSHAERRNDEKNHYIYQFSAIANCFIWLFRGDTSGADLDS